MPDPDDPAIATICLFYAVEKWNAWFDAAIWLSSDDLYPLQLVLRDILISNQTITIDAAGDVESMKQMMANAHAAEGMKYAIIFIASAPLLIIYPFLQKYFEKGVMIGAVKG